MKLDVQYHLKTLSNHLCNGINAIIGLNVHDYFVLTLIIEVTSSIYISLRKYNNKALS